MDQVIVLGGGLAGLSAAHTVYEQGGSCTLLDKSSFCGGNSTKATSGINGSGTSSQRKLDIQDSQEVFEEDIMRGGSKDQGLAKTLANGSASGVEWLKEKFELDLSLVSRLGGHSQPRTHRGKAKFPGMTITYALLEKWEEYCESDPKRAKLINKARGSKLITNDAGDIIGCEYELDGKTHKMMGAVIIATGGFGADFSKDSLLQKHRPDLAHLPTTNGEHCTGDGIKMAHAVGGESLDLEWVQVHPTGLVHPDHPDDKVKFLAAEALRGCGGVLLDKHGNRFANELGRRDYVTGRMWKNEGPFRLCLNGKASKEIEWHCKHYKSRGLMKFYNNMEECCKDTGMNLDNVKKTFAEHNEIEKKNASGTEGQYDAYGGGKTHDPWGKKFFQNGPLASEDMFHVAIVTPVIHYCMGGLKIDHDAQVLNKNGPIKGLYGAGEVNGGIHGENRLGGNALLECVVYGRVAGRSAARHLMKTNTVFVQSKL